MILESNKINKDGLLKIANGDLLAIRVKKYLSLIKHD